MYKLPVIGVLVCGLISSGLSDENDNVYDLCARNITEVGHPNEVALAEVPDSAAYLSLCDNSITKVGPKGFKRFRDLQLLRLNGNRDLSFPDQSFLDHENLSSLECIGCGVDKIYNHSLRGLPNLELINLTDNVVGQIGVDAFQSNPRLENIDLHQNQLISVPIKMLAGLSYMKILDLSSNVHLVPHEGEPFLVNVALQILKCDKCGFTVIYEKTFSMLPNLSQLHLRKNRITTMQGAALTSHVSLTELMLENNRLKSINANLLTKINKLCLDGNQVELNCYSLTDSIDLQNYRCLSDSVAGIECVTTTATEVPTTEQPTTQTKITTDTVSLPPIDGRNDNPEHVSSEPAKSKATEVSPTDGPSIEPVIGGISDAYISGYLFLIIVAQGVTLIFLTVVLVKLQKSDADPDIDLYAAGIVNPSLIYKAIH